MDNIEHLLCNLRSCARCASDCNASCEWIIRDAIHEIESMNMPSSMNVWIVSRYSVYDYDRPEIEGVFTTEELANKYIAAQLWPSLYHKEMHKYIVE